MVRAQYGRAAVGCTLPCPIYSSNYDSGYESCAKQAFECLWSDHRFGTQRSHIGCALEGQTARQVGCLLAISKTSAITDGHVVAIAIAVRPATIVTSDVKDITHLLQSAKIPYAEFGKRVSAAAQVIVLKV